MMTYYLKLYFATLIAFFAIDMVWLGLVARTFYREYLGFFVDSHHQLDRRGDFLFIVRPGDLGVRSSTRAGG